MDPLTHALSGALLARVASPTRPTAHPPHHALPLRWQIAAGFIAAAFPDIDLVLRLIDTLTYLNWHQGPTHSLVLLPVWAGLLAWSFSGLSRGRFGWQLFYQPACLGLTIHIAGDLITSYGLMLFAPFSTERYSLPLVFVIDPWFSLIIAAGLIASWRYPRRRIAAIAALLVLCGYVIFLFMLHQQAAAIAHRYAESQTISYSQIDVLPQPLSPFHWKIIIRNRETYHIADIDLSISTEKRQTDTWLLSKMTAAYRPVAENNWKIQQQFGSDPTRAPLLREAWLANAFTPFRAFAQFPVLEDSVDVQGQKFCAWFYDLRFKFPELPPSFRYGVCRENDQTDWQMARQRGVFYID
ncbi:metal-dependent hydrolase [Nitrosomonas sp. sh817]|uniref:metal-dependent hydrolase n=1 Tax=Nitrosomonas sp. sh817 TaxID=3070658 RepID=UPI0027DB2FE6|nr:metal-dependent hydrolase [Nitrosomonas sp. sh817]WMJ09075.1 metal-dependent hydrolase [Nitrosomonas sp. sh817]